MGGKQGKKSMERGRGADIDIGGELGGNDSWVNKFAGAEFVEFDSEFV